MCNTLMLFDFNREIRSDKQIYVEKIEASHNRAYFYISFLFSAIDGEAMWLMCIPVLLNDSKILRKIQPVHEQVCRINNN